MDQVREAVRNRYAEAAERIQAGSGCCEGSCCEDGCGCSRAADPISAGHYAAEELAQVGASPLASLGCGNPAALAALQPGEVVLDLGSGAGLDVLLSARRVAPTGHAYGVDMTDEMLALANANKLKAGISNVSFLKGTIDAVPLPDASVDVIISNCVINLALDKSAVLREAYRLLKPGGRLAVSDMVETQTLAPHVKTALDAWAGCIAGTIPAGAYRDALVAAGFVDADVEIVREFGPGEAGLPAGDGRIASASIRARKP